jgi:hypothetical protein
MSLLKIPLVVTITLLFNLLVACYTPMSFANPNSSATPNNSNYTNAPTLAQGIQGTVVRLGGNQMPTIGMDSRRTPPESVQTSIWVFSGRIKSDGSPYLPVTGAQNNPQLLQQVKTDAQGKFAVYLPPGEYTLFAQYGDNLYLNSFQGDGSFTPVEVTTGTMTETNLVHTEDAAF